MLGANLGTVEKRSGQVLVFIFSVQKSHALHPEDTMVSVSEEYRIGSIDEHHVSRSIRFPRNFVVVLPKIFYIVPIHRHWLGTRKASLVSIAREVLESSLNST